MADVIESALPDILGADRARFAGRHTLVVGAGHSRCQHPALPRRPARRGAGHDGHLGDPQAAMRCRVQMIAGHAFMQNLRRGHYEIAIEASLALRVVDAFTELVEAI